MIYHLFEYLQDAGLDFPGLGLLNYLSVRAMLASVTAILVALIFGKKFIAFLKAKQVHDEERSYDKGLAGQELKNRTPSMGGVIIIISILAGALLFCDLTNIYVLLMILATLWCGALGFADDYVKAFKHNKDGVSEKTKLIAQAALGLVIGLAVWASDDIVIREKVHTEGGKVAAVTVDNGADMEDSISFKEARTTIPLVKNHEFDYQWLFPFEGAFARYVKWILYVLMIILVVTACSNGVNLTDGIDGLAAGTSAIVGIVLGILAWLSGNVINSSYLNIMFLPGTGEMAIFMAALVGALLGFLWYNSYPASIFMGDTGSLALGGIIGVSAVLLRKELLLPILCGIFLMESLSVIMQRMYFKIYKRKHGTEGRIWSRAPLHHHFQANKIPDGYIKYPKPEPPHHEAKITVRFWIVGILLAVGTLALLKLR